MPIVSQRSMRPWKLFAIAVCVFAAIIAYGIFGRIEDSRDADPSGRYYAVWSHQPYQYLPMIGVGTGSSCPCFVKIVDSSGRSFGEIPVLSMQVSNVDWTLSGAEIRLVGEWNLNTGTCFYWSEDQLTMIQVR